MIKVVMCFFVLMVMISAGTVYSLKETTERLEARKHQLSAEILKDRAAIKVLRAEMAYLSQPDRLQKLSERFLALTAIKSDQLTVSGPTSSPISSIAVRENLELVSFPVDDFPLLLPQEKPEFKKGRYNRPVQLISYPAMAAKKNPASRPKTVSFYDRISLKIGDGE